jgi:diaminopimelate decarboxylase
MIAALVERYGTPLLVLDRATLVRRLRSLPFARVGYTVGVNPHPDLIHLYHDLGCTFAANGEEEIRHVLALGVPPARVRFGAAVKRQEAIQYAASVGVDLLAFDSSAELLKIAKAHPGCRVLTQTSDNSLLERAAALGLQVVGVEVPAERVREAPSGKLVVVRGVPRRRDVPAHAQVSVEPGRWLLDPAAVRIARVIGRTRNCYYLDDGELAGPGRFRTLRRGRTSPVTLAGPTGDILAQNVPLPDLAVGDVVWLSHRGAARWGAPAKVLLA